MSSSLLRLLVSASILLGGMLVTTESAFAESPGLEAIEKFRSKKSDKRAVENRFFLKEGRFEISPVIGYVPNNPFARRFVGGAVLGYHFSELLSVQFQVGFSPDLGEGDLKPLTSTLVDKAQAGAGAGVAFQQPLDKVGLFAAGGLAWSPLYGKINLVGETVLNFDFYLFGGVGMISKNSYFATYDDTNIAIGDIVNLSAPSSEVKVSPSVGFGQNYFLNQTFAFKLDVRASFYVDQKPQYDPNIPVVEQQLYNNVVASFGVGAFFPKMKPRLYDF